MVTKKAKSGTKNKKAAVVRRQAGAKQATKIAGLKRWNIIIAVLLALQAVAIFIAGKASTLPVVARYLATDTLATQAASHKVLAPAVRHMFFIDIRYLVIAFLLVSVVIHWLIASRRRPNYEAQLQKHVNTLRWIDYGLSAGIMLVLIAMLNGAYDVATLLAVFVLVALLHFLAYFGEAKVSDARAKLQTFVALCVVGATVWFVVFAYLKAAIFYGNGLNLYVYLIDGAIFAITLGLAYNVLQVFRSKGKWTDYIFGERIFMLLSFVAKTALTWLVFAGFLR